MKTNRKQKLVFLIIRFHFYFAWLNHINKHWYLIAQQIWQENSFSAAGLSNRKYEICFCNIFLYFFSSANQKKKRAAWISVTQRMLFSWYTKESQGSSHVKKKYVNVNVHLGKWMRLINERKKNCNANNKQINNNTEKKTLNEIIFVPLQLKI